MTGRHYFFHEWRTHRKLTQQRLAERVGVSTSSVSQLENDKQGFTNSTLEAYAEALSCEPGDLLMYDPNSSLWSIVDTLRRLPNDRLEQIARIVETFRDAV